MAERGSKGTVASPEVKAGDGGVVDDQVKGSGWVAGARVPTSSILRTLRGFGGRRWAAVRQCGEAAVVPSEPRVVARWWAG